MQIQGIRIYVCMYEAKKIIYYKVIRKSFNM